MKKIQLWMLAAILTICGQTVLTSCSDDDDNNNQTHGVPGTAQRDYKLDWKIVNDDRQLVALDGVMGNILRAELDQIQFEYMSVGPDMKTPVRLTGTINMPRHIFNKSEDPDQLLIYHQWTHAANFEKVFNDGYNAELGIYMNEDFNTIAISSDSYGWTLTKDKPQAYCSHEIQAVAMGVSFCWGLSSISTFSTMLRSSSVQRSLKAGPERSSSFEALGRKRMWMAFTTSRGSRPSMAGMLATGFFTSAEG